MTEYEKDLNGLKEDILKDGDTLVSKRALLKRFCEMDKEYNGCPWNLLQILSNINVLIGEESCEDAISREDVIKAIDRHTFDTDDGLCLDEDISIILEGLPPVTPTQRWIPVSERLPKCEQKVLVLSHNNTYTTITTGMYEDGSMSEWDSMWNWEDVEFEKWDDENDCGIVPEGWYEYHEFNPDGVLNYEIYGKVVAWMPLPEPYKYKESEVE